VRLQTLICVLLFAPLFIAAGCDSTAPNPTTAGGPSIEELAAKMQGKKPEAAPTASAPQTAANPAENTDSRAPVAAAPTKTGEVNYTTTASDRGPAATQGGYGGAIIAANRTMRTALDDIAWKKSVQLFEAEHGRKPRDTKEFLERVKGEGTPLPGVPDGFTYHYIPDEGQFGQLYQVPIEKDSEATPPSGR
jgi:hypothetical protein